MIVWAAEIEAYRTQFLQLESMASAAYNGFVYADQQQADFVRDLLFDRKVGEFAAPHSRAVLGDGMLEGFISALSGKDLHLCRMKSAMAIAKAGLFEKDEALYRRMQIAATTSAVVEDEDYYISRVAVSPESSGRGLAGMLLCHAQEQAENSGARRLILEVASDNDAAHRLYRKHGFQESERREAHDPHTGRSLSLVHMTKAI